MKTNFLFSTAGLVKKTNEDEIGIRVLGDRTRVCVCDGHWGKEAAHIALYTCLQTETFPSGRLTSIKLTEIIQKEIYNKFGHSKMNSEKDFTPETSLLAVEIDSKNHLNIFSYGDCRLMISRDGKIIFKLKTVKTWLGAFSFIGLRNRASV